MSTFSHTLGYRRILRGASTVAAIVTVFATSSAWGQTPTRPVRTTRQTVQRPGTTPPGTSAGQKPGTRLPGTTTSRTGTQQPSARGQDTKTQTDTPETGSVVTRRGTEGEALSSSGESGQWEPFRDHPIEWQDIPDGGKKIVSLDAREMSVNEFMETLALTMGWTILMDGDVSSGTVNAYFNNISIADALKSLRLIGLYYEYDKTTNIFHVMTQDEYYVNKYGKLERSEFSIRHIDVTDMQNILQTVMSPLGRIVADQRQAKLIIHDTADNQKDIKRLVEDLDVEIEPVVMPVDYIDAEDMAAAAVDLLSLRGSIEINMQDNTLIVADIPESVKRVRERIDLLDIELEPVVMPINYIDAEDASTSVTELMSARGNIEVNTQDNTLIVRDIPESVKRIRERIALIDIELEPIVFNLEYVRADEVADIVAEMLSARGYLEPDMRTNQLLLSDIPEKVAKIRERIELLDVDLVTETFDIKYALLEDIEDALMEAIPDDTGLVNVDERMKRVMVTSTELKVAEAAEIIEQLDKKSRQVHIKAYILRVNATLVRDLGIQWSQVAKLSDGKPITFSVLPSENIKIGNSVDMTALTARSYDFGAVINLLLSDDDTEVLSEPEISVIDGEQASFRVQKQVPFLSGTGTVFNVGGGETRQTVQYKPVGILLDVLPTISITGDIEIEIMIEDSNFTPVELPDVGTVPQVETSNAQTKMIVTSGSTVAIGGLRTGKQTESVAKVPLLGDIPFVGPAFRTTHTQDENQELLIFITPTSIGGETASSKIDRLDRFRESMNEDKHNMRNVPLGSLTEPDKIEPVSRGESTVNEAETD